MLELVSPIQFVDNYCTVNSYSVVVSSLALFRLGPSCGVTTSANPRINTKGPLEASTRKKSADVSCLDQAELLFRVVCSHILESLA